MLLRMTTWERIRDQFTQAERDQLNSCITRQVICPRGATIDESALSVELRDKLRKVTA